MVNKDKIYINEYFRYTYPYSWDKRNKNYLKKKYNRKIERDFMVPIVFRLRFYNISGIIISDDFYNPENNTIFFPTPPDIEEKVFSGWKFSIDDNDKIITQENYDELKYAVMGGYDDIKLYAYYEDILND